MLTNLNNLFLLSTQAQEYLRYFLGLILITLILNTVAFFEGSVIFILSIVPVVTYSNSDTMKESVVKENKGKSGVYRWTNKITGYTYIGSSVKLDRRLRVHISNIGSVKLPLYNALNKYGLDNYAFMILQYCDPVEDVCLGLEQNYRAALDLYKPNYNILKLAGSSQGFKHSPETIAKLKKNACWRTTP